MVRSQVNTRPKPSVTEAVRILVPAWVNFTLPPPLSRLPSIPSERGMGWPSTVRDHSTLFSPRLAEVIFTFTVSSGWENSGSWKDSPMASHTLMAWLALNVRPSSSVTLAVTV